MQQLSTVTHDVSAGGITKTEQVEKSNPCPLERTAGTDNILNDAPPAQVVADHRFSVPQPDSATDLGYSTVTVDSHAGVGPFDRAALGHSSQDPSKR